MRNTSNIQKTLGQEILSQRFIFDIYSFVKNKHNISPTSHSFSQPLCDFSIVLFSHSFRLRVSHACFLAAVIVIIIRSGLDVSWLIHTKNCGASVIIYSCKSAGFRARLRAMHSWPQGIMNKQLEWRQCNRYEKRSTEITLMNYPTIS